MQGICTLYVIDQIYKQEVNAILVRPDAESLLTVNWNFLYQVSEELEFLKKRAIQCTPTLH